MTSTSSEIWPDSPEVDRVYFFVREMGEERQLCNFIRFSDGSAVIFGASPYRCEGSSDAWRSGFAALRRKGYRFHSAGGLFRMDDFIKEQNNPLPGGREWACAIHETRPESW